MVILSVHACLKHIKHRCAISQGCILIDGLLFYAKKSKTHNSLAYIIYVVLKQYVQSCAIVFDEDI
jgi:hypothetical protein